MRSAATVPASRAPCPRNECADIIALDQKRVKAFHAFPGYHASARCACLAGKFVATGTSRLHPFARSIAWLVHIERMEHSSNQIQYRNLLCLTAGSCVRRALLCWHYRHA